MSDNKYVTGPKGTVLKKTNKGKKEVYKRATSKDMSSAGTATRLKYAGRVRQQERERNPKPIKR